MRYIYWGYVDRATEGWVKNLSVNKRDYDAVIYGEIYDRLDDYKFADFTYNEAKKSYQNSDGTVKIAFTFDKNTLVKIAIEELRVSDGTTSTYTITFGDAVVHVPANAVA